ncbi:hypothetical protein ACVXZ4_04110 [Lacisediminihabitans sp. FW035]
MMLAESIPEAQLRSLIELEAILDAQADAERLGATVQAGGAR